MPSRRSERRPEFADAPEQLDVEQEHYVQGVAKRLAEQFFYHPERTGQELRNHHRNHHDVTQRQDYIAGLVTFLECVKEADPNSKTQWEGMFDGGLVQALLDVALDKDIYRLMHVDGSATRYVTGVYSCLSWMKHAPWARQALRTFPKLWALLLQLRELVTFGCDDDGFMVLDPKSQAGKQGEELRDVLCELLMSHMMLSRKEEDCMPTLRNGDIGLVVLLTSTCGAYIRNARPKILCMLQNIITEGPDTGLHSYLDNASARHALIPTRFIGNMVDLLLDDELLNVELCGTLKILSRFFEYPALKAARAGESDFPLAILAAAQRQVCSGASEEWIWDALHLTFLHVMDIILDDEGALARSLTRDFSHPLVMLTARALCPAAMDASNKFDAFDRIMLILTSQAALVDEPALPQVATVAFRTSVQQVWHRAHANLVALPAARALRKDEVLQLWRALGAKCGVDLNAPYVPPAPSERGAEVWTKEKGCAWRECLCFGERPNHKLRKCTRCEQVMYCSTKCQKQDWNQGGHKHVCRR
ncbi:zinc finger MYND domain-containing protein [Phanerochaete sordida]|uniref:Zinc finger MYND domain-containing protein n=1 Tax=Phanerochaete sordida TaxID=48140 RepID=A0A9P3LG83_9APHY|nr:zinc finger MYND domain-containing protein [Phanerochaete sordida]